MPEWVCKVCEDRYMSGERTRCPNCGASKEEQEELDPYSRLTELLTEGIYDHH